MNRSALVLAAATLATCSDFTTTDGGIASIEVFAPSPAEVEVGVAVQLRAVARNTEGDSLDIPIYWRSLDTTIAVDSTLGQVSGLTAGQTGRVVARAEDLYSSPVTFTVLSPADTVVRVTDSAVTVAAAETASPELVVRLDGGDPAQPVPGWRVTYDVIAPVFATLDDRTVEFPGGLLAIAPRSSAAGTPEPAVTLQRRIGQTQPDTALVRVTVYRPDGTAVAGSGLLFYVLFEN